MLGNPIYTGAILFGALLFAVYCYFNIKEGEQQSPHRASTSNRPGNSYSSNNSHENSLSQSTIQERQQHCSPHQASTSTRPRNSHSNSNSHDNLCVICQNTIERSFMTLRCQHTFHAACIGRWYIEGGRTCPLCRHT